MDIIKYGKELKLDSFISSVGFEKAIDSLEISFSKGLLKHMGFGQSFLNTLQAIYEEHKARIRINNASSSSFSLFRGTCQGDPL